jgi:antitoxin HigA-1
LAVLLNTSPESWLRMQEALDLWEVQQNPQKLAVVKPLPKGRLAEVG